MKKILCFSVFLFFINSVVIAQYVTVTNACGFKNASNQLYKPLVCNYGIQFLQDNTGAWYISPEQGYSINSSTPDGTHMFDPNSANHVNGPTNVTLSKNKILSDLARIKSLGFTEIRLAGAAYRIGVNGDTNPANGNGFPTGSTSTYFNLMDNFLTQVDAAGLKVIYALGGMSGEFDFTNNTAYKASMKTIAAHYATSIPGQAIMAYDLHNEPANRLHTHLENDKYNFTKLYSEWANSIKAVDPNHLITIGFYGISGMSENDPTLLPIDFVSFHLYWGSSPYSIADVKKIMNTWYYWTGKVMTMPWIIGETSYSAEDNVSPWNPPNTSLGTETDQKDFADYTLRLSVDCNCKGYSWWKYQNTSWGIPYEDYMGIYNIYSSSGEGTAKPVASSFPAYAGMTQVKANCPMPNDYYSILNGTSSATSGNSILTGYVRDNFGNIVPNAVISAFDNTWTKNFATFSDATGMFTIKTDGAPLGSFKISYPGYSNASPAWPWTANATYALTKVNYNSWVKEWTNSDVSGTLNYGSTGNWSLSIYDKFYKGDFNGDGKGDLLCVKYSGSSATNDRMTILTYTNTLNTVSWVNGTPVSNITSGWTVLWDNNSNVNENSGIYPYRNNIVVGDFDGNGQDDVLGIGSTLWTTWFTFVPNANPAAASWQWQDSNYGTVNDPTHPMSYMTPYSYRPVAGNFYSPNTDAVILSMPSGGWMTSFQLVGGTWTWYQSNFGHTNDPAVGYEMSYLTPYIGNLKTGDFNGDGITDILGGAASGPFAYLRPEWNPTNSNYKWAVKWTGSPAILTSYTNMVVGNYDADYSDEMFVYNGTGNCAHVNFDASYAPYLDGTNVNMISDWSMNLLTAYTHYVFLKTDENSTQEQLLCLRNPNAALYSFRPNAQALTPCSTLRLASSQEETKATDLKKDGLSVFPNPSNGAFLIEFEKPIEHSDFSVKVFDVEGREIKDFTMNSTTDHAFSINLNHAKTGIYFLHIVNNKEVYSKKIVVF